MDFDAPPLPNMTGTFCKQGGCSDPLSHLPTGVQTDQGRGTRDANRASFSRQGVQNAAPQQSLPSIAERLPRHELASFFRRPSPTLWQPAGHPHRAPTLSPPGTCSPVGVPRCHRPTPAAAQLPPPPRLNHPRTLSFSAKAGSRVLLPRWNCLSPPFPPRPRVPRLATAGWTQWPP